MTIDSVECSDVELCARDGFALSGTLYRPRSPSDRVVVINSATAVPRRFYRHFAMALANQGFVVVTYDYRGIGGSRPEQLRGFGATMRDWGLLDMAGVVDWVCAELSPGRLLMVGHSVGGQVAGLLDNSDAIDGMVTFSSQSGHWRLQGGEQKAAVLLHSYVTMPVLSTVFGYLPGRFMGSGEDLPKQTALEWAAWCRDPKYLLGDSSLPLERFETFQAPVLAYSFGDDKWGTPRSVDAMMSAYPNVERRHIDPGDLDLPGLGHFGFFRPKSHNAWHEPIAWLERV